MWYINFTRYNIVLVYIPEYFQTFILRTDAFNEIFSTSIVKANQNLSLFLL